jgi:hypothetical protein
VPVSAAPASGASIGTLTFSNAAGHVVQTQKLVFEDSQTVPVCAAISAPRTAGGKQPEANCSLPSPGKMTCTSLPDGETCSSATTTPAGGPGNTRTPLPTTATPPIQVTPVVGPPGTSTQTTATAGSAAGSPAAG